MFEIVLQLVLSGLLLGGIYALIAMSLTLVWGVLRVINFAHGDFVMMSMYLSFLFHIWLGWDPYYSLVLVAGIMFLFGLFCERIIIRRTLNAPHMAQVFATFGLAILLQNSALLIWKANMRSVVSTYSGVVFRFGSLSVPLTSLVVILIVFIITCALFIFLKFSYPGKAIRATAQNKTVAMLMGVNITKVYSYTFAIGALLTGVAGALLIQIYSVYPLVGLNFILAVFVIVVLGGLGNVPGALIASLVIGVVETVSGYFIGASTKQAVIFLFFILVLLIRPSGLLGRRGEETIGT